MKWCTQPQPPSAALDKKKKKTLQSDKACKDFMPDGCSCSLFDLLTLIKTDGWQETLAELRIVDVLVFWCGTLPDPLHLLVTWLSAIKDIHSLFPPIVPLLVLLNYSSCVIAGPMCLFWAEVGSENNEKTSGTRDRPLPWPASRLRPPTVVLFTGVHLNLSLGLDLSAVTT